MGSVLLHFSSPQNISQFRGCLTACILGALLSTAFASDPIQTSEKTSHPPEESPKKDAVPEKEAAKYDVTRIGQRGIGKGFNFYSLKREHELGERMASAFDHGTKIVHDPVINEYVNRLAQRIVVHSDADVPFTVKVIDSGDIPRAYGLPGGFLYVDSALIADSDGEAELVSVMAHEIAHVAARHATRAMTRKDLMSFVNYATLFAGPTSILLENAGGLAGPLSTKKFSRDAEYEADLLGIEYAYSSGYDPQALLDALEKLHSLEEERHALYSKIPGYHAATKIPFHSKLARSFASYPLTEERIQRLQSEITAFLPTRSDYIIDTDEFQEIRSRVLAAQTPVLRHHDPNDEKTDGPVLRRTSDYDSAPTSPLRTSTDSMVIGQIQNSLTSKSSVPMADVH